MGDQTNLLGDEERASQDMRGGRSDGRRSSTTILDDVLTVGESAKVLRASWLASSSLSRPLEGLGWGYEKLHGGELL